MPLLTSEFARHSPATRLIRLTDLPKRKGVVRLWKACGGGRNPTVMLVGECHHNLVVNVENRQV